MKTAFGFVAFIFMFAYSCYGQSKTVDSLKRELAANRFDTNRVLTLIRLADQYKYSRTDSAIVLSGQAFSLARKLKFLKGEAAGLNLEGASLGFIGDYPNALEKLLEGLKIVEKTNEQRIAASILNNIGGVYSLQGDSKQALVYAFKAKALSESIKDTFNLPLNLINIGDNYASLNRLDSARIYTQAGYELALSTNNTGYLGLALNNLGNIHLKMKHHTLAMEYYRLSIPYYQQNQDDEGLCETTLGMARIFLDKGMRDSALYYAKQSLHTARNGGFTKYLLDASTFLADYYHNIRNVDSAYAYLQTEMAAKDSLFSQEKVKQVQNLSIGETLRQQEIAEEKTKATEERRNNMQLLIIAAFIFLFTLFVILVGKRRTKTTTINFMITVALLLMFEFLSLFIHPYVAHWTHHTPIYMLLILVIVAAILAPMHHRLEHWIKEYMAHKIIHPKTKKMKVKKVVE